MAIHEYDASKFLHSEEGIADYLNAAMEAGGIKAFQAALGDAEKARRHISKLSADTGITRKGLYQALDEKGNPSLETITKILTSIGIGITFTPLNQGA